MKIIDMVQSAISHGSKFYSFEYFPPKTESGKENLLTRIDRMANLSPLFINVTWTAGSDASTLSLDLAINVHKYLGVEVLLHLTCIDMKVDELRMILTQAKEGGVQNILALRGDLPQGIDEGTECENDFSHAIDLVRFIKKEFGDYFGIAVAGFPECHVESSSVEEDIKHLKAKIDAGADFIITQLFYDYNVCIDYIKCCRKAGISCPIIPGIMPIHTSNSLERMSKYCKVEVPTAIIDAIAPFQDDDAAVKVFGIKFAVDMIRELLESGLVPGVHFYTLNLERSVTTILEDLGLISTIHKKLPWRASNSSKRASEGVRPIFWANRPKSYLLRTETWDEFPNGRWGDSRSPAFGRLCDHHIWQPTVRWTIDERKEMWGESPQNLDEIFDVFAGYIEGTTQFLPWCETGLALETGTIKTHLLKANKLGCMTINSQPRVCGAKSNDPVFGWGGPNGTVYQKAYVEFFCSAQILSCLMNEMKNNRHTLTYHAVDRNGNSYSNNLESATAVTWGVWPKSEIKQPTVVDPVAFLSWKDECFSLLLTWADIYPEDSVSAGLIHTIYDDYFLVNIVDNDFVNGDLFSLFECIYNNEEISEQ